MTKPDLLPQDTPLHDLSQEQVEALIRDANRYRYLLFEGRGHVKLANTPSVAIDPNQLGAALDEGIAAYITPGRYAPGTRVLDTDLPPTAPDWLRLAQGYWATVVRRLPDRFGQVQYQVELNHNNNRVEAFEYKLALEQDLDGKACPLGEVAYRTYCLQIKLYPFVDAEHTLNEAVKTLDWLVEHTITNEVHLQYGSSIVDRLILKRNHHGKPLTIMDRDGRVSRATALAILKHHAAHKTETPQ